MSLLPACARRLGLLCALTLYALAALALSPAAAEAQLAVAGRVVDDSAAPLPGVSVTVTRIGPGEPFTRTTLTDAEGRFRVEVPAPGVYRYLAERPGLPPVAEEVEVTPAGADAFLVTLGSTAPAPGLTSSRYFNLYDVNFFSSGFTGRSDTPRPPDENANQVKFRVSVRYRLIDWKECDSCVSGMYAAYSQTSFWHLYDHSAPFFDNNYSPGALVYWAPWENDSTPATTAAFAGLFHESNGRDEPHSRGWQRWIGGVSLGAINRSRVSGSITLWHAWGLEPTNPDLVRYAGRGEVEVYVQPFASKGGGGPLTLQLRSRILGRDPVTNLEANLLWQLPRPVGDVFIPSLFAQVFTGYAENLLTYDERRTVLRVGLGALR